MSKGKTKKITSGTKEWADTNINLYLGCENGCRYCYAMKIALRFGRIQSVDEWKFMKPNLNAINKGFSKKEGRIMFPTSHDITIESYENCLLVLKKLISAGNEVLITTKPRLCVITKLISELNKFKEQIQFRFTITSIDDSILKFWEPYAPNFNERFLSLVLACSYHYKTSVSIEPFLDKDPFMLIKKIAPFCSESIWIGKMNYIKATDIAEAEKPHYKRIREISSWPNILKIMNNLCFLPDRIKSKIRIKDSIRNMYAKRGLEVKIQ
ncbi:MAG: hypothetical protein ACFFDF_12890 [Candidatus Odinarchaeota archaeon]